MKSYGNTDMLEFMRYGLSWWDTPYIFLKDRELHEKFKEMEEK